MRDSLTLLFLCALQLARWLARPAGPAEPYQLERSRPPPDSPLPHPSTHPPTYPPLPPTSAWCFAYRLAESALCEAAAFRVHVLRCDATHAYIRGADVTLHESANVCMSLSDGLICWLSNWKRSAV